MTCAEIFLGGCYKCCWSLVCVYYLSWAPHIQPGRQQVKRAWLSMLFLCWAGECQDELDKWCAAVKPGEGRLAKCLGDELAVEGQAGSKGSKMSEGCKQELISFKIQRSTNINMDLPLAKACKADAEKFCANKYEVGRARS